MGKNKREYWGLDLETSGTTHEAHVPIQLGMYAPDGALFNMRIGGWQWEDPTKLIVANGLTRTCWKWDTEAQKIHNLTKEELEVAPDRFEVQRAAARFITEHGTAWIGNRLVVGWNVASFDMPFIRMHLPALANSLSYRSVDLNAVAFAVSEGLGLSYGVIKKSSKEYAEEVILREVDWHDAAYDAEAAVHSLDYLVGLIQGDKRDNSN